MKTKLILLFTTLFLSSILLTYLNIWFLVLSIPSAIIFIMMLEDIFQKKHSLRRNFPIIARLRWVFESERDKIRQYFNESDLDGTPFNKEQRSDVYQKSKNDINTVPFGTQHNVYEKGHEFVKHSIFVKDYNNITFNVGGKDCKQPYRSSIINISAMSYGSLSGAAVRALNLGAKQGGFAQNTGEGGISEHHLQGGDLIFQVGTGYFGCGYTDSYGKRHFSEDFFTKNANRKEVKMIEIKLSQGAKPGHGGILPAKKNTEEIAKIRGIKPYTKVESPGSHSEFSNFDEMCKFIEKLRYLSNGKPVGIKLCVTSENEIQEMFRSFQKMNIRPDFITIDGSEGGTGSAPLEFSNNVGTPLIEGLTHIKKMLHYLNIDDIKLFASGKVTNAFDIVRLQALGADGVNIARGFMMSMGCIQARECNLDTCPVGIATQNKTLEKGLVVKEKYLRVYNFYSNTIKKYKELVGAMGISDRKEITSDKIFRRMSDGSIKTFLEIYSI
jgi:glutamate synthase domain-containing protein 2